MLEVERKWLVRVDWGKLYLVAAATAKSDAVQHILQAYPFVCRFAEMRVRQCYECDSADHRVGFKFGNGRRRLEFEFDISVNTFEQFFATKCRFSKTRLQINGWLIDQFNSGLDGLYLMEREEHDGEAKYPMPDGIEIVREVTNERTYANKNLAKLSWKERRTLVQESYNVS